MPGSMQVKFKNGQNQMMVTEVKTVVPSGGVTDWEGNFLGAGMFYILPG